MKTTEFLQGMKLSSQGKVPYALAIPVMQSDLNDPRPIKILYFIQHCWILSETCHFSQTFAVCKWPQQHPSRHVMGKPVEVWCKDLFETGMNCFVPIENIVSRVIIAFDYLCEENVVIVIPFVY